MRWSKSPWWRYHQCHCRRRQQCLIKLYNLERLKWSPMRSDLKSRTLPLAVAVLCVRILSDFLPIKLQLLLFRLSFLGLCMRMTRTGQKKFSLAFLSQQWLWSPGLLKCQCIMPLLWHFHNGIWWVSTSLSLSGFINVKDSELPVSLSIKRFVLGNSITLISQCICMVR